MCSNAECFIKTQYLLMRSVLLHSIAFLNDNSTFKAHSDNNFIYQIKLITNEIQVAVYATIVNKFKLSKIFSLIEKNLTKSLLLVKIF